MKRNRVHAAELRAGRVRTVIQKQLTVERAFMRKLAVATLLALMSGTHSGSVALAAKAKPAKAAKAAAAPPAASAEEINKLKGDFKWGMTTEQVAAELTKRIQASYADKLKSAANDPMRDRELRKQLREEIAGLKGKYVKFDGQRTGYDVSIIDQEFGQGTGESMMTAKEANATRYFFFNDEKLYKMFVAFDKEMLQGKGFAEFGALMQSRFGKAKEVFVEEKQKGGVTRKLDHYEWSSKSGDGLRLVDRSEFYDVFCLVVYDNGVATRLAEARRMKNPNVEKKDALVEAVTAGGGNGLDPNDDIVDRVVGKQQKRPGDERHDDIVVPSSGVRQPTPAEVNRKDPALGVPAQSDANKAAASKAKPAAPSKSGLEL